jgi:hypothetical protein
LGVFNVEKVEREGLSKLRVGMCNERVGGGEGSENGYSCDIGVPMGLTCMGVEDTSFASGL